MKAILVLTMVLGMSSTALAERSYIECKKGTPVRQCIVSETGGGSEVLDNAYDAVTICQLGRSLIGFISGGGQTSRAFPVRDDSETEGGFIYTWAAEDVNYKLTGGFGAVTKPVNVKLAIEIEAFDEQVSVPMDCKK